jgi:hypothetical protein
MRIPCFSSVTSIQHISLGKQCCKHFLKRSSALITMKPMITSKAPLLDNNVGNVPKNTKSDKIASGIVIERPTVAMVGDVSTTDLEVTHV